MSKTSNRSNNRSNNKSTIRHSSNRKANGGSIGRVRPMAPKAGVTKRRTRYDEGGEWCW